MPASTLAPQPHALQASEARRTRPQWHLRRRAPVGAQRRAAGRLRTLLPWIWSVPREVAHAQAVACSCRLTSAKL